MGRLWTAVLVLVAIFTVHGAQCAGASHDIRAHDMAAHGAATYGAGSSAVPAMAATAMAGAAMTAAAERHAGLEVRGHVAAAAAGADTSLEGASAVPSGSGSGPGSWAAHLWTVCLAVLAAGLAVLLAVAARRLTLMATAALVAARSRVPGWLLRAHPPDLHVLCVLRT